MGTDCSQCFFSDVCSYSCKCKHFYSLEDEQTDDLIEENRADFTEEWYEYIEEQVDD